MLRINVPSGDFYDERTQEFIHTEGQTILLEHSLASLAKWERHWRKPFLSKTEKTRPEMIDYIRCMTITEGVDRRIYSLLTSKDIEMVSQYIDEPMTATTFSERGPKKPSREIITAEVIYYWMVSLQIPFECQYWHLNTLLTLIRVCNIKNQPSKKGVSKDDLAYRSKLNAERKKRLGTKG